MFSILNNTAESCAVLLNENLLGNAIDRCKDIIKQRCAGDKSIFDKLNSCYLSSYFTDLCPSLEFNKFQLQKINDAFNYATDTVLNNSIYLLSSSKVTRCSQVPSAYKVFFQQISSDTTLAKMSSQMSDAVKALFRHKVCILTKCSFSELAKQKIEKICLGVKREAPNKDDQMILKIALSALTLFVAGVIFVKLVRNRRRRLI